jgi:alkanesulfonate monooxygenase SsuD/methylene tetrahydromethanopterin reductase-like flavin-dependent oxidoreductase (luciferase family)
VLDAPYALIGVSALAADDEREAHRQILTGALAMVRLRTGRPGLIPSPEEAAAYPFSPVETEVVDAWLANVIHGTQDAVREGLNSLAKSTGADELMITANAHTPAARLHSYELIADAYGLPEPASDPASDA